MHTFETEENCRIFFHFFYNETLLEIHWYIFNERIFGLSNNVSECSPEIYFFKRTQTARNFL